MFKKTVLVHALTLAFSGAALTVAVMNPAMAQSNATGTVYGTVTPGSATTVVVENAATGLRRVLTPDAQGRFQATSLPPGSYNVTQMQGTTTVASQQAEVSIGQGAAVNFAQAPSGAVQTVNVTGQRRTIDVASTNSGATFNARQLAALPIARNVEAIIQLAPNTTRADSRFSGGASFGGGAASENSYYINGFPVVNPLTGLGASQLPFGAIAEAQVLTGGFGAEFGRSIGGVVNIITKSGTNTWEAGAMLAFEPKSWRASPRDIYYANTGVNPSTDNTLRLARRENTREQKTYGAYVGGPLIKDKLFIFGAAEVVDREEGLVNGTRVASTASNAAFGWRDRDTEIKRYMVKLDWNINDNHRLEFTSLEDTPTVNTADSGFSYATRTRNNVVTASAENVNVANNGGKTNMLKYTGNLTQDLTVTALYGRTDSEHTNVFQGYNPNQYQISFSPDVQAPGLNYTNPQSINTNILDDGSKDIVKSARLDLEYRLGAHTLRGGIDRTKVTSLRAGDLRAGGGRWTYLKTDTPTEPLDPIAGVEVPAPANYGGLGTAGYYVTRDLFSTVTDSYGEQSAYYLEDKWQVLNNVLLTLGVRNESFKNQNDSKTTFLDMKDQIQPRIAAAWDVFGDASLKVYGTAGRYSVPIPTHISVRGAGRSTFTAQYYTYTGVDANGNPTGLNQMTPPLSSNNEYGQDKVVATLAALDMKPAYQDEMSLGFERAWSPTLNFGGKVTYRKLKSTIDDFCDARPFTRYARANNIAITNPLYGNSCQTFNPGQDNTFMVQYGVSETQLTKVSLSAAEQGFEKPKRTYAALDLFMEHPFRNGWYGKMFYTLSSNKGNTEGQVRSDNGQADVAVTSTWDYPELMVGSYGRLPNDRKHQIKAFGFYEVTKEITVGGNILLASGRPRSCIGTSAQPGDSPNYANQSFWCLGSTTAQNRIVPRGTVGNLPWDKRLDLNVAYRPNFVPGLQVRFDVFNALNDQTLESVSEAYNNGTRISSTYELPLSYTAPRSARVTLQYDKKF
jgi:hypothetical protein